MFSKNIRTIYLYLVCFITLFLVIGGTIAAIYSLATTIFPTSYNYSYYNELKYDEDYLKLSDQEAKDYEKRYKEIYEKQHEENILREKNRNIKEVIYSLAFVVVALPIYAYNWKKIEQDKSAEQSPESVGE